jgi:RNA polymerase sigma-70 factor (ECF subfamily)
MENILIQKIKNQDAAVIGQLFDDYGNALYGVILRIVGQSDLAEQVLQDSFVKIWKNGHTYDESKGKLFTWMLNIARNTAIDVVRSAGFRDQRKLQALDNASYAIAADNADPHLMDMRAMVDKLDEKYRVIVQKIYFEGYSHAELSEALGIPLGTVKTRLRYALGELRGLMGVDTAQLLAILAAISKSIH